MSGSWHRPIPRHNAHQPLAVTLWRAADLACEANAFPDTPSSEYQAWSAVAPEGGALSSAAPRSGGAAGAVRLAAFMGLFVALNSVGVPAPPRRRWAVAELLLAKPWTGPWMTSGMAHYRSRWPARCRRAIVNLPPVLAGVCLPCHLLDV